ncbi:hypothetical protein EMCRGX_G004744 [Ephydatia muelleri]
MHDCCNCNTIMSLRSSKHRCVHPTIAANVDHNIIMSKAKCRKMLYVAALLSIAVVARAMINGAPSSACTDISPALGHSGASQSLDNSPFSLNVSALTAAGGYTPGQTYTLTLTGTQQYRGLLVQGRRGTTPVGSFSGGQLTQTVCTANTGVTHTSNTLKNNVQLTWTAPPKGTGNVAFSYAVVVQNSLGVSTYYATLTTAPIIELGGSSTTIVSTSGVLLCVIAVAVLVLHV